MDKKSLACQDENEYDPSDASYYDTFEEWNNYLQSVEPMQLDEYLPAWGMTNLELRKFIWNAEHSGEGVSYEAFKNEISTWKHRITAGK